MTNADMVTEHSLPYKDVAGLDSRRHFYDAMLILRGFITQHFYNKNIK